MKNPHHLHFRAMSLPIAQALVFSSLVSSAFAAPYNQAKLDAGIQVWRNSTDALGRTCVDCHGSPDGIDLAYWNLTAADLRRRDAKHISAPDSEKIVGLMEELRKKFDIVQEDIRNTSPFQPGGSLISGNSATERDAALMESFKTSLPTLALGNVNSKALADQAVQEILNLDLNAQKIGIEIPRWSRDRSFGDADGRLTEWISDVAMLPKDQTALNNYYDAQDVYLANPTTVNFWKMFQVFLTNTKVQSVGMTSKGNSFQRSKYMSALIGSHDLRMEALGLPRILDDKTRHSQSYFDPTVGYSRNIDPMFDLGEMGQNPSEYYNFPTEVTDTLDPLLTQTQHVREGKDPWWFIGWLYNPGSLTQATRHEYFPNSLLGGQFVSGAGGKHMPTHAKYITTVTDVYNSRLPLYSERPYYNSMPGNKLAPFNPVPTFFATNAFDPDRDSNYFSNETHKTSHIRFANNITKMRLYMINEDLQYALANNQPFWNIHGYLTNVSRESWGSHDFLEAKRQLDQYDPTNVASNATLFNEVRALMSDLKNGSTSPVIGTGIGLKATIFDDMRLSNAVATRTDETINYYPGVGNANHSIYPDTNISVRWTGSIQPQYSGVHKFNVLFPDGYDERGGVRIWVDEVLVYDHWNTHVDYNEYSTSIDLVAGTSYSFRVEYKQGGDFQQISVRWESPKQLNDVIPKSQLYPSSLPIEVVSELLVPVADTYSRGGQNASSNYGASSQLEVWDLANNAKELRRTYIKFPLSGLNSDAVKAELSILMKAVSNVDNNGTNPSKLLIYRVDDDSWSESGLTWSNQPVLGDLIGEVDNISRQDHDIRIDISDILNSERVSDGFLSIALVQPTNRNTYMRFYSRESGERGPRIVVYGTEMEQLTSIDPNGNVLLGLSESYSNQDLSGETQIAADGKSIRLTGNNWKRFPLDYTVTSNTVLQVTINSQDTGEISGIGLENDNKLDGPSRIFQLGGSQNWANGIRISPQVLLRSGLGNLPSSVRVVLYRCIQFLGFCG